MGITTDEFPLLKAVGLYVKDTIGNGNCLFNALSDQMFGDQSHHSQLRASTVDHMRDHSSYYKQFIDVHPGGGVRRNPKRKNAGAYSTSFTARQPTQEEIDKVFESHLSQMAKGGAYGDNMEISAFSTAFNVDIKIYQREFAYVVSAQGSEGDRPMMHIAYHTWEHYSSIRNVRGPHSGPPNIQPVYLSPEAEAEQKKKFADTPCVLPWMVNVVTSSLPYLADRATIQKALEDNKGNINLAVSKLLEAEDQSSASSRRASSSVERDPDSDDELISGPSKKQDRRLSRAAKSQLNQNLAVRPKSNSHPAIKDSSPSPDELYKFGEKIPDSDETDDDWRNDSSYQGSRSPSACTSASDLPAVTKARAGGTRLRLSQPKREDEESAPPSSSPSDQSSIRNNAAYMQTNGMQSQRLAPRKKRLTRRDKIDIKKAAQKAAAKERKQMAAAGRVVSGPVEITSTKTGKENAPAIEAHIKVLYI